MRTCLTQTQVTLDSNASAVPSARADTAEEEEGEIATTTVNPMNENNTIDDTVVNVANVNKKVPSDFSIPRNNIYARKVNELVE